MFTADLDRSVYVAWEHPLEKGEICMESIPLRALPGRTLRSLNDLSEIGGILWGSVLSTEEGKLLLIKQAEFINGSDKLFNSTEADLNRIVSALNRPRADLEPVGYFRSSVRGNYLPLESDQRFLNEHMPGPDVVCLIIEPQETGICVAHFYLRQDGNAFPERNLLEVPLLPLESYERESVVALEKRTATGSLNELVSTSAKGKPQTASPHRPDYQAVFSAVTETFGPVPPTNRFSLWAAGFAVLIAVSIAAFWFLRSRSANPAANPNANKSEIALQVSRRPDGQLDLNWSRNFIVRRNPIGAKLTIHDGASTRELELSDGQLRSGTLAYFPMSDDTDFRLELFLLEGRSLEESVRVLSPAAYASRREALDDLVKETKDQVKVLPPSPKEKSPIPKTTQPGAQINAAENSSVQIIKDKAEQPLQAVSSHETNPAPELSRSVSVKSNTVPSNSDSAFADIASAIAPVVSPVSENLRSDAVPSLANANLMPSDLPKPPDPPHSAEQQAAIVNKPRISPAKQTTNTQLFTSPPPPESVVSGRKPKLIGAASDSLPYPVKQVMPDVKMFGISVLVHDLKVQVEVMINSEGRVTKAIPTGAAKGSLLAAQAVTAAQQWRFEPARRNGVGVPSTYLIRFSFQGPTGTLQSQSNR